MEKKIGVNRLNLIHGNGEDMKNFVESRCVTVVAVLMMALFAVNASAEGVVFDTSKLESTATGILAVGAVIAIGFAVFRIGRRGANEASR
jgi:hypothetical protein